MEDSIFIGQLDVRISIMENIRVTSSTGEKTVTPQEVNKAWAKVEDVAGSEETDGKIIALNVRRYTIRYDPTVAAKKITDLYIVDGSNSFNIHSTSIIGRKDFLQLKCSKRE